MNLTIISPLTGNKNSKINSGVCCFTGSKTSPQLRPALKFDTINNRGLAADTVSFTSKVGENKTPEAKMLDAVAKILDEEVNLQPGQPIYVTADKTHVPFLKILAEEAYKKGSGAVVVNIVEPELDAMKAKYCKEPDFAFIEKEKKDLKENGAAFLTFDKTNSPYKLSGLSKAETKEVLDKFTVKIPTSTQKKLEIDPEEFFKVIMPLEKGQPLRILAEREHENNVLKIAEYAYKNGMGPVHVDYVEPGEPFARAKYKYADEKVLKAYPQRSLDFMQELVDRKVGRLRINGGDESVFADIDPERMSMESAVVSKALKNLKAQSMDVCPWNVHYIPTTLSVKAAYPEIEDPIKALDVAAGDFKKINRYGMLNEHVSTLDRVAKKMNEYNFKEIHFVSVDPKTREADGKTDLYVGLSPKSRFISARLSTKDGMKYLPNTPTEEVFSTPDKTKTRGVVSATMPLSLNGKIVEGIKIKFEDGKMTSVSSDTNEDALKSHIKSNENADMLGEVALVVGSPIFDTGRVFNSTLLDENAACHLAMGNGYDFCIEGASDIEDQQERKKYLDSNNMNDSTTHNDFMIGGPNVTVEGIKANGEKVTLIKDNKFQI